MHGWNGKLLRVDLAKGKAVAQEYDASLDREEYDSMLQLYYEKRGWDSRGMPKMKTLTNLGPRDVAQELTPCVKSTV